MNDSAKNDRDLTITLRLDTTANEAFEAITNVRAWWSGEIEGPTDTLGAEFTYRYETIHYSKQRITELVPGKRVVWLVLDSHLSFIDNKREWDGTKVTFDIAKVGDEIEVRFTHAGLAPTHECYAACSDAWGALIRGALRGLIATGQRQPDALASARRPVARAAATRSGS